MELGAQESDANTLHSIRDDFAGRVCLRMGILRGFYLKNGLRAILSLDPPPVAA